MTSTEAASLPRKRKKAFFAEVQFFLTKYGITEVHDRTVLTFAIDVMLSEIVRQSELIVEGDEDDEDSLAAKMSSDDPDYYLEAHLELCKFSRFHEFGTAQVFFGLRPAPSSPSPFFLPFSPSSTSFRYKFSAFPSQQSAPPTTLLTTAKGMGSGGPTAAKRLYQKRKRNKTKQRNREKKKQEGNPPITDDPDH